MRRKRERTWTLRGRGRSCRHHGCTAAKFRPVCPAVHGQGILTALSVSDVSGDGGTVRICVIYKSACAILEEVYKENMNTVLLTATQSLPY